MIYIAYKYTLSPNKRALRKHLEHLAEIVSTTNYQSFILHRDKKNWSTNKSSQVHSAYYMLHILPKAKQVLAFIDHNNMSYGLMFEFIYAKLLGKPITLLIKRDVPAKTMRWLATNIYEFDDYKHLHQLEASIKQAVSQAKN